MTSPDKVILITGASSGLGRACAHYLAERGYRVFGTSRRQPDQASVPFTWLQMDVDDDASVRQGVAEVLEQAGRVDVVVNNAGFGYGGAIEDTSLAEARAQLETNFFGTLRVCFRENTGKFVSAVTCCKVCCSLKSAPKCLGDSFYTCVACGMTVQVIVLLEIIYVYKDERQLRLCTD